MNFLCFTTFPFTGIFVSYHIFLKFLDRYGSKFTCVFALRMINPSRNLWVLMQSLWIKKRLIILDPCMLHFEGSLNLSECEFNIYESARLVVTMFIHCRKRSRLVTSHPAILIRELQTILVSRYKKTPHTLFVCISSIFRASNMIQYWTTTAPMFSAFGQTQCPKPFNKIFGILWWKTLIVC